MRYVPREFQVTNQRELRRLFWKQHPHLIRAKLVGEYACDTRVAFVDWIDRMARNQAISESLAQRATL